MARGDSASRSRSRSPVSRRRSRSRSPSRRHTKLSKSKGSRYYSRSPSPTRSRDRRRSRSRDRRSPRSRDRSSSDSSDRSRSDDSGSHRKRDKKVAPGIESGKRSQRSPKWEQNGHRGEREWDMKYKDDIQANNTRRQFHSNEGRFSDGYLEQQEKFLEV